MHRILPNEISNVVRSQLPKDVLDFVDFVTSLDFHLTLVGGAVRDFLFTGQLSKDLDFEIRHDEHLVDDNWLAKLVVLQFEIQKNFEHSKIETLAFGIFKVTFESGETVEVAPARVEKFIDGRIDHKNFEAHFISDLNYKESVVRRDITINAMGLSFTKSGELILRDPTTHGESDVTERVLRQVTTENFTKDPVRLLRAVRFAKKFNLSYAPEFLSLLPSFNLAKVSPHYFISEGLKSDFYPWAFELKRIVAESPNPIELPDFMKIFFNHLHGPMNSKRVISTVEEIIFQGMYYLDMPEEVFSFISVKQKTLKALAQLSESLKDKKSRESEIIFSKLPPDIQESLSYIKTLIDLE